MEVESDGQLPLRAVESVVSLVGNRRNVGSQCRQFACPAGPADLQPVISIKPQ